MPSLSALLLAVLALPQEQDPAEPPPLSLRVNRAIARGVEHLRGRQQGDGRWVGDETRYPGGLTAFTAYTLAKSGCRARDPSLVRAVDALAAIEPRSTYGASARLILFATLPERARVLSIAERCLDQLVSTQTEGLWAYPEGAIDLSNVQFAVLGLWAARELGLDVPADTLASCAKALWRFHEKGAGFHYNDNVPVTTGMTAGTLCTIEVLRLFGEEHAEVLRNLRKEEKARAAAEAWLTEHWNAERNQWGPSAWTPGFHFAYLWAVERLCELLGLERLGDHDWYAEGAEYLMREQHADGGWGRSIEDTCFALLFLRRSTFTGGPELAALYEKIDAEAEAARPDEPPPLDATAAYLTDWLVAGPVVGTPGETGLHDLPFQPKRVRIGDGKKVGKKKLERLALPETTWTNLEDVTGRGADHCIWILATELVVDDGASDSVDAVLWFALEDGWRIFLDGEEVSSSSRVQAPIVPDVRVAVTLAPGEHQLLVVAEDALGSAAFGARLSSPDGKAPPATITHGVR